MKNQKSRLSVLGFVLGCTIAAIPADAPKLTFKFNPVNIHGALQTIPKGVSNAGVSVGAYQDKNIVYHGYILEGKTTITLDPPNSVYTFANGINPNGAIMVVGNYSNSIGISVGFLYKGGKFTDIPGPTGATYSAALGVNDSGNIVGVYNDSAGVTHGFLLTGKTYRKLNVPGATGTFATGINKSGIVCLYWLNSSGKFESSLWNGRTYKTINVPEALGSFASGIDTAGDVAYQWYDSNSFFHGALLHAGKYYKFNYPGAVETFASGINDKDLIVGASQTVNNGASRGFEATYK